MANEFIIKNGFHSKGNSHVTGSLNVTGSADFSNATVTGISTDPFPFVGDAVITGSLIISGSANVFKFDQTALIIGQEAGDSLTATSVDNTFLGRRAGFQTSTGDQNVFVGDQAGQIGDHTQDVAVGHLAGVGYTGGNNVSIGWQAGYGAAAASAEKHNTQIGAEAGRNNWRGSGNTFIGYRAGYNGYDNEGCIIIGSGSIGGPDVAAGGLTQQLRIGNGNNHIISGSLETGELLLKTVTLSGSLLNTGTVSISNTDSPYTITGTQQFILIDPSGGSITVNMPDAATYPGRQIFFKLTQAAGANTVTLQRQGSDTIDGATTYTDLDIQYESISTVSNGGTGWFIF